METFFRREDAKGVAVGAHAELQGQQLSPSLLDNLVQYGRGNQFQSMARGNPRPLETVVTKESDK